jgi:hypothetical protein
MHTSKVPSLATIGKSLDAHFDNFVAIDWSMKVMAIARLTAHRQEPHVFERPTDLAELKLYLKNLSGATVLTFEETTTAQWLYLELKDCVDHIIICDPYRNRLLSDGPKTDKIDAAKLCLLLRAGLLKPVFHTADKLYHLRHLASAYDAVVKAGVRALNQRSALLQAHGSSRKTSTTSFILLHLDKSIELYRQTKKIYEKQLASLCRKLPQLRLLLSIPGIGPIGAVKILSTVIDPRRFPKAGHFLSYCGLVKLEKTSGQRSYGLRTPRYSRSLKCVYKTATASVLTGNNPMTEYYQHLLNKGVAEHNARHAVARFIARISYGVLKSGKTFEPYRWQKHVSDSPSQARQKV